MVKISKYFTLFGLSCWLIIQGCDKKETSTAENPDKNIIDWIYDNLEVCYFWNEELPKKEKTKINLKPEEYFESLLNKDDKFSWIQDNFAELIASLSGVNREAGYDFNLMRVSRDNSDVIGYITYIKPGTSAEEKGLRRGNFFLQINGRQLTLDNYMELIGATSNNHTLGIAKFSGNNVSVENTVPLTVKEYAENPILLDTIYNYQDKKIGYFVYNFFARDSEQYGIKYEKELNDLFGRYIGEKIDELIIDLRYNNGGSLATALALASMISNRTALDVFGYEEYNSLLDREFRNYYGNDFFVSYFLDEIERYDENDRIVEKVNINKLGISRVHLIVSYQTASASELIINCLRPYMGDNNVVLIGETTRGKNIGSFTIYERDKEKQKTNNWGMQPIVLKLSNKNKFSDYGNGFIPHVEANELDELFELLDLNQLGDTNELLLSTAFDMIYGITRPKRANVGIKYEIIGSAIDITPARKNMYKIHDRKISIFGRN